MSDFKKGDIYFQPPALLLWILILIFSFADLKYLIYSVNNPMNFAGTIIVIGALIFRVYEQTTLNRNYSYTLEIREEHHLVTNGLYKYIRHPIYSGVILGIFSVPIYSSSLRGFLLTILAIPLFMYRIRNEERMLVEEFGGEYERYQEQTWRLFPYIY